MTLRWLQVRTKEAKSLSCAILSLPLLPIFTKSFNLPAAGSEEEVEKLQMHHCHFHNRLHYRAAKCYGYDGFINPCKNKCQNCGNSSAFLGVALCKNLTFCHPGLQLDWVCYFRLTCSQCDSIRRIFLYLKRKKRPNKWIMFTMVTQADFRQHKPSHDYLGGSQLKWKLTNVLLISSQANEAIHICMLWHILPWQSVQWVQ